MEPIAAASDPIFSDAASANPKTGLGVRFHCRTPDLWLICCGRGPPGHPFGRAMRDGRSSRLVPGVLWTQPFSEVFHGTDMGSGSGAGRVGPAPLRCAWRAMRWRVRPLARRSSRIVSMRRVGTRGGYGRSDGARTDTAWPWMPASASSSVARSESSRRCSRTIDRTAPRRWYRLPRRRGGHLTGHHCKARRNRLHPAEYFERSTPTVEHS